MITHIQHVTIPVNDLDKAMDFYRNKLGFRVVEDRSFGEKGMELSEMEKMQRWVELEIPGAQTRVVLQTAEGQEDQIGRISPVIFSSNDIAKTYEDLKSKEVPIIQELTEQPWGAFAIFSDPDGNLFCLSSTSAVDNQRACSISR